MQIIKRSGELQQFNPNKILNRLKTQAKGLSVDYTQVFLDLQQGIYNGIKTIEIDELAANVAASYTQTHPDFSILASRLIVSRLQKEVDGDWTSRCGFLLTPTVIEKQKEWDVHPIKNFDYIFDYFGITTFLKVYALKYNDKILETPSEMYFRVALFLADTKDEFETYYKSLCEQKISLATPILINAGTKNSSMISCALLSLKDDSLEGIDKTLHNINKLSKDCAGIGLWIGNLRSNQSRVNGGGKAGGVVRFAKMLDEHLKFFNQSGKRPGSAALYLDVWHRQIEEFLELRLPEGDEGLRARDLFLSVVINDLFYQKCQNDEDWYLFDPNDILKTGLPNLYDVLGETFEDVYNLLVHLANDNKIPYKKVKALEILQKITHSQIKTGLPYIFNKENANRGYNQSNWGVCKSSNLCIEYIGYSDENNEAQCCLGSLVLSKFAQKDKVDYENIVNYSGILCEILNKVIDKNSWSTEEAMKTGLEQRTIGIGLAGMADLFAILDFPFISDKAREANKKIMEAIYYGAIKKSSQLAESFCFHKEDKILKTPLANGKFHWEYYDNVETSLDWKSLREQVKQYGVRNSLLCCLMPTAGTSILLGCNEMYEPFMYNINVRETMGGEFVVINKFLVKDLEEIGLWNDDIAKEIIINNGSIQFIDFSKFPKYENQEDRIILIKEKYKTIWEISQKELLNYAADRQPFLDQSQSLNLYISNPDYNKLANALFYGWSKGLKTGSYYVRTQSKLNTNKDLAIKTERRKEKPKDSIFECVGCST